MPPSLQRRACLVSGEPAFLRSPARPNLHLNHGYHASLPPPCSGSSLPPPQRRDGVFPAHHMAYLDRIRNRPNITRTTTAATCDSDHCFRRRPDRGGGDPDPTPSQRASTPTTAACSPDDCVFFLAADLLPGGGTQRAPVSVQPPHSPRPPTVSRDQWKHKGPRLEHSAEGFLLVIFSYAEIDRKYIIKDIDPIPLVQHCCVTVSGALGATLVYTLQVIKTRLQAQQANSEAACKECLMCPGESYNL